MAGNAGSRAGVLLFRAMMAAFWGLGVTALQVVLPIGVHARSNLLNWTLPGYLIFGTLFHHLKGVAVLAIMLWTNILTHAIIAFALINLWRRKGLD